MPSAPEMVIELLNDDELLDPSPPSAAAAPTAPDAFVTPNAPIIPATADIPEPTAPCALAAWSDARGDEEFARRLFIELNREAMGIPKDGGLVILSDDDEKEVAGEVADEEEELDEEDEATGSGSPPRS